MRRSWAFASKAERLVSIMIVLSVAACGDDALECVELPADCAPLYPPTYDELFARTFEPTCGQAGSFCHAAEGARAGLVFAEPDEAYELLNRSERSGGSLVRAGDAACSPLMLRLSAEDPSFSMPPGTRLSEQERCVVQQWIEQGAAR
jgi:hypothetical protein